MNKKLYLGFDLGDGESIVDFVVMDASEVRERGVRTHFVAMTMPAMTQPGVAIPTVYGYVQGTDTMAFAPVIEVMPDLVEDIHINFKRRPTDLTGMLTEERQAELLRLFSQRQTWPEDHEFPEGVSKEMSTLRQSIVTFVNAIFEDKDFSERVRGQAEDADSVVFCVGHPTRWNELDAEIYRVILAESVLGRGEYAGKPSELLVGMESRAAFLTVKDKAVEDVLPPGTSALLVDVGSSTIDVTAMTADANNHQYNSGNNYLGARSIDLLIREFFLSELSQNPVSWKLFERMRSTNPDVDQALTLLCRRAKERMYSMSLPRIPIQLGQFAVHLTREQLEKLVSETPIAPVLVKYTDLPQNMAIAMGDDSWKTQFLQFMRVQKQEIASMGLKVGRIILTGSASRMPVVTEVVKQVYAELPDGGLIPDMNPSNSISQGLALVGPSNEKSKAFQADVSELIETVLPEVVDKDLPELADSLADIVAEMVSVKIRSRMNEWREGEITTLRQMSEKIQEDCNEENMNAMIQDNPQYHEVVSKWAAETLGPDIALKLQELCKRYGVKNINLDTLNVMKVPDVKLEAFTGGTQELGESVLNAVAVVAGVIAAIALPTVLGVVIGLLSFLLVDLAFALLMLIIAIPGVGQVFLVGVFGVAVFKLIKNKGSAMKDVIAEKLQDVDIPKQFRGLMSDKKISDEIEKANLKGKIAASITREESRMQIATEVASSLGAQIERRMDDIKYVIESR